MAANTSKLLARGRYYVYIDGKLVEERENKIPVEGLNYLLRTGVLGAAQITQYYIGLFSGAVNPADNWTAANFTANASEITSPTEGYSNGTRPVWTPTTLTPATPLADNLASLATFNITCSSTLNISGCAMLSSSTKGGTAGILLSATRFNNVHVVNNGSTFQVGYEFGLIDV